MTGGWCPYWKSLTYWRCVEVCTHMGATSATAKPGDKGYVCLKKSEDANGAPKLYMSMPFELPPMKNLLEALVPVLGACAHADSSFSAEHWIIFVLNEGHIAFDLSDWRIQPVLLPSCCFCRLWISTLFYTGRNFCIENTGSWNNMCFGKLCWNCWRCWRSSAGRNLYLRDLDSSTAPAAIFRYAYLQELAVSKNWESNRFDFKSILCHCLRFYTNIKREQLQFYKT